MNAGDECEDVLVAELAGRHIEVLKAAALEGDSSVSEAPYSDRFLLDVKATLASYSNVLAERIFSRVDTRVMEWDLWETHKAECQ